MLPTPSAGWLRGVGISVVSDSPTHWSRRALKAKRPSAAYRDWSDGEVGVRYHSAEAVQPERRLMRAVLADAVRAILDGARANQHRADKLHREALAWIVSEDRSAVFAFENVCETLGIDAGWFRAEVLTRESSR